MNLMSNLFECLIKEDGFYTIKLASKEHKIFKAHFPENPILPGFIQIDIISVLENINIMVIKKAKFLSLVKPDDVISYKIIKQSCNRFKAVVSNNKQKVSEIIYETK